MRRTRNPCPPFCATTTAEPSAVTDAKVWIAYAVAAGLLARVAYPPARTVIYNIDESFS